MHSARISRSGSALLFAALIIGGAIGAFVAARVEMTKMPELVAAMHSLIGLAAVCIAYAVVSEPAAFGSRRSRVSGAGLSALRQSRRAVHRHVRRRDYF